MQLDVSEAVTWPLLACLDTDSEVRLFAWYLPPSEGLSGAPGEARAPLVDTRRIDAAGEVAPSAGLTSGATFDPEGFFPMLTLRVGVALMPLGDRVAAVLEEGSRDMLPRAEEGGV